MQVWQKRCIKIFTVILAALLLGQACIEFAPGFSIGGIGIRLGLAALESFLALIASGAGTESFSLKKCLRLLLLIYALHLISVLFFEGRFGREPHGARTEWFSVNWRPFFTIKNYWNAWRRGNIGTSLVVINLAGNLMAFLPMGFLLPLVWEKPWGVMKTALCGAAMIAAVEMLQRGLGVGSCDIDDFILNFAGLLAARLVLLLPFVRKSLEKRGISV